MTIFLLSFSGRPQPSVGRTLRGRDRLFCSDFRAKEKAKRKCNIIPVINPLQPVLFGE